MMTVSLCHSLLEYPLWYVYFLVPFALMMSLSPADVRDEAAAVDSRWQRLGGGVLALLLITGLLRLAWVYHDLTAFSVQGKNDSAPAVKPGRCDMSRNSWKAFDDHCWPSIRLPGRGCVDFGFHRRDRSR